MVEVRKEGETMVFAVKGWHRLWALKGRLVIPRRHIVAARHDPAAARGPKGLKAPGTHIPGLLTAGTFYRDGKRIFWDVRNADHAIVVDLADETYHQLIIEVADPQNTVRLLRARES